MEFVLTPGDQISLESRDAGPGTATLYSSNNCAGKDEIIAQLDIRQDWLLFSADLFATVLCSFHTTNHDTKRVKYCNDCNELNHHKPS